MRKTTKGTVSIDKALLAAARTRAESCSLRLNQYLALLLHNDQVRPSKIAPHGRSRARTGVSLSLPAGLRKHAERRAEELGCPLLGALLDELIARDLKGAGPFVVLPKAATA